MKITISQENSSPIEIEIAERSNENLCPERSQEFFLVDMALGFLVFYLICILISIPFTIANNVKDKKLLKIAESMISKMTESEKTEIKKFVDTILSTQKTVEEQVAKKFKELVMKHTKAAGLKTRDYSTNISDRDDLILKDNTEKEVKALYKKIIKILNDTTGKASLTAAYEIDESFVIEGYYAGFDEIGDNDVMLDKTGKAFDAVEKELEPMLSSIVIDKSKFSLSGGADFDEYESCPDKGKDGLKIWAFSMALDVNRKYINKVFKPLFDRCKLIK